MSAISDAHFNLVRHTWNQVGGRIWELMDGVRTVDDIRRQIALEYRSVASDRVDSTVSKFVDELQREHLATTRTLLGQFYGEHKSIEDVAGHHQGIASTSVSEVGPSTDSAGIRSVDVLLLTTPRPPQLSPKAVEVSENSAPPLGLLCVAAALERAGLSVAVYDFYRLGGTPTDVKSLLERVHPKIVGVSTLTSGVHLAFCVCEHIKRANPNTITVVGGPHVTALPDEVAARREIDYVVRGEGEQTMVELAKALLDGESAAMQASIAGIAYKHEGRVVVTPERMPMRFDDAPLPARHLVPMEQYLQKGAIITSRGCTYRCWFCSSVTFSTHLYRYRSAASVLSEMDLLHQQYGIDEFEFIEDTFTCVPGRVLELMSLLKRRNYVWACQATIPDLQETPELLPAMIGSGCRGLFFGIESGDDSVLRKIKHMSRKKVLETIDGALDLGIQNLVTSFIIGHPWDTRETIADTISLILELRSRGAHTPLSILVPFPGSPIGKWPERFGVTVHSHDYAEYYYNRALISTPNLSREELWDLYLDALDAILSSSDSPREPAGELSRSRM